MSRYPVHRLAAGGTPAAPARDRRGAARTRPRGRLLQRRAGAGDARARARRAVRLRAASTSAGRCAGCERLDTRRPAHAPPRRADDPDDARMARRHDPRAAGGPARRALAMAGRRRGRRPLDVGPDRGAVGGRTGPGGDRLDPDGAADPGPAGAAVRIRTAGAPLGARAGSRHRRSPAWPSSPAGASGGAVDEVRAANGLRAARGIGQPLQRARAAAPRRQHPRLRLRPPRPSRVRPLRRQLQLLPAPR